MFKLCPMITQAAAGSEFNQLEKKSTVSSDEITNRKMRSFSSCRLQRLEYLLQMHDYGQ